MASVSLLFVQFIGSLRSMSALAAEQQPSPMLGFDFSIPAKGSCKQTRLECNWNLAIGVVSLLGVLLGPCLSCGPNHAEASSKAISLVSELRPTENVVLINLPVYGQASYDSLIMQAESLANREIARQFEQNPTLTEVQVVVNYDYNGEIAPILAIRVSRSQWQETPQATAWANFYNASYSLLRRHETLAALSDTATATTGLSGREVNQNRFDEALDAGGLSGGEIQENLDDVD